jgi:hypothetical protein
MQIEERHSIFGETHRTWRSRRYPVIEDRLIGRGCSVLGVGSLCLKLVEVRKLLQASSASSIAPHNRRYPKLNAN